MSRHRCNNEPLVQQAFSLVLEMRAHRQARRLLTLAVAFLEMLVKRTSEEKPTMVISVQAVRIPKL